jgi:hypothetical protein
LKRLLVCVSAAIAVAGIAGGTVLVVGAQSDYDAARQVRQAAASAHTTRAKVEQQFSVADRDRRRARHARDERSGALSTIVSEGRTFIAQSNAYIESRNDLTLALNAAVEANDRRPSDVVNSGELLRALDASLAALDAQSAALQKAYKAVQDQGQR